MYKLLQGVLVTFTPPTNVKHNVPKLGCSLRDYLGTLPVVDTSHKMSILYMHDASYLLCVNRKI